LFAVAVSVTVGRENGDVEDIFNEISEADVL